MAINKVIYGNETLIDITDTTATDSTVLEGTVFYNAAGVRTVGSALAGISDVQNEEGTSLVSGGVATIPNETFIVNAQFTDYPGGTADKSPVEIKAASEAGKLPVIKITFMGVTMVASLQGVYDTNDSGSGDPDYKAVFSYLDQSGLGANYAAIVINSDKTFNMIGSDGPLLDDFEVGQKINTALSNYVPTYRKINGKALNADVTLSANDVQALPASVQYVSSINGNSGNVTITAESIGAVSAGTSIVKDVVSGALTSSEYLSFVDANGIAHIPPSTYTIGMDTAGSSSQKIPLDYLYPSGQITPSKLAEALTAIEAGQDVCLAGQIYLDDPKTQSTQPVIYNVRLCGKLSGQYLFGGLGSNNSGLRPDSYIIYCIIGNIWGEDDNIYTYHYCQRLPKSADIPSTYSDVGAASASHTHTAVDVGAVPTSRTVNGKALSSNITLNATDVGALPSTTAIPSNTSDLTNDSGFITTSDIPKEVFVVRFSGTPTDGSTLTADKTLAEIQQAAFDGKKVVGLFDTGSGTSSGIVERQFQLTYINSTFACFTAARYSQNSLAGKTVTVESINYGSTIHYYYQARKITVDLPTNVGGDGQMLIADSTGSKLIWADIPVTDIQNGAGESLVESGIATVQNADFHIMISGSGTESSPFTIDKTWNEIQEAYLAGKRCYIVKFNGARYDYYPLTKMQPAATQVTGSAVFEYAGIELYGIVEGGAYRNTITRYVVIDTSSTGGTEPEIKRITKTFYSVVNLPYVAGTSGQILVANSTGKSLVWADMPSVPSISAAAATDTGTLIGSVTIDSATTSFYGPVIPSWAQSSTKPTYTASEVGALASTAPAANITAADISSWNAAAALDTSNFVRETTAATDSLNYRIHQGETDEDPIRIGIVPNGALGSEPRIDIYPWTMHIQGLQNPDNPQDAATKAYVDSAVASISMPSALSELTNDVGFITSSEVPSEIFTVTIDGSYYNDQQTRTYTYTKDKTYAEILAAFQSGKICRLIFTDRQGTQTIQYTSYFYDVYMYGTTICFASVRNVSATGNIQIHKFNISNTESITYAETSVRLSDTYSPSSKFAMTGVAVASALSSLAIPSAVSELTNDSGYLTLATLPIYDGSVS